MRPDKAERLLLIDTCGETAGVALGLGEQILAAEDLLRGSASAESISAVRRLLSHAGWTLRDLDAVGVVCGPGSFTGIRAGLAAAKGLCVAAGLPLAAVSRLEVLADAASLQRGFAVLDAGRGELYVREIGTGREWLSSTAELEAACVHPHGHRQVVAAEERVAERLAGCAVVLCPLHVGDALSAVLRRRGEGDNDTALTDANYVREPDDIYRKPARTMREAS